MHVGIVRRRQRISLPACIGDAKNALGGVVRQSAANPVGAALEHPGIPAFSFFHPNHLSPESLSPGHGQQAAAGLADTVAQRSKPPGGRIIPGDGADAGDSLFQMDPQPGAVGGGLGNHPDGAFLSVSAHAKGNFPSLPGQCPAHILGTGNGHSVNFTDLIADL